MIPIEWFYIIVWIVFIEITIIFTCILYWIYKKELKQKGEYNEKV